MRAAFATATCCLLLPILVLSAALGGVEVAEPSSSALEDIPPTYLALYQEAATELGMPWELLAAIGKVESDHGRNPDAWKPNKAGAQGPMQFLPITFGLYSWASGSADPDIYDPRDAIYAAAALLVDNNVRDDPRAALRAYNDAGSYVDDVLGWAAIYKSPLERARPDATAALGAASPAAAAALSYALAQVGTPYRFGGDEPGGFDCSGLVQAAYRSAGLQLPRTAQEQYNAGRPVPDGQPLQPGDLVFFGPDTIRIEHVGILVNQTEMVDAPYTGALVRIEPYRWSNFLAATRPGT